MPGKHVGDPQYVVKLGKQLRRYPKWKKTLRQWGCATGLMLTESALLFITGLLFRSHTMSRFIAVCGAALIISSALVHVLLRIVNIVCDELHEFQVSEYEYLLDEGEVDLDAHVERMVAEIEQADALATPLR